MNTKKRPEKRKTTIVKEIEYWWCGSDHCSTHHKSVDAATKCPKALEKKVPPMSITERINRANRLWQLVVVEGKTITSAAKEIGLSQTRAGRIVNQVARRRGYGYRHSLKCLRDALGRPDGMDYFVMLALQFDMSKVIARHDGLVKQHRSEGILSYARRYWVPGPFRSGAHRAMQDVAFIGVEKEFLPNGDINE